MYAKIIYKVSQRYECSLSKRALNLYCEAVLLSNKYFGADDHNEDELSYVTVERQMRV